MSGAGDRARMGPSARRGLLLLVWAGLAVAAPACGGGSAATSCEQPAAEGPTLATLAFVGDTNGVGTLDGPDGPDPLAGVAGRLGALDAMVFNQEGVVEAAPRSEAACPPWPHQSSFHQPPWVLPFLRRAPVTVGTLGNNHVLDCGEAGLLETLDVLALEGIDTAGAGPDLGAACAPLRRRVGALDVAMVAYLVWPDEVTFAAAPGVPGVARWEACDGAAEVAALRAEGAFVVVVLHLHRGTSGTSLESAANVESVEAALDAGADLVVGHGAHVPQSVLTRSGGVGLLGLGNFLFPVEATDPEAVHRGLIARIQVHAAHLDVRLDPVRLDASGRPHVPDAGDAEVILGEVARASARHGTCLAVEADHLRLVVPR